MYSCNAYHLISPVHRPTLAALAFPSHTLCHTVTIIAVALAVPTAAGADPAVLRGGAGIRVAHHFAGHPAVAADRVRVKSADCSVDRNPIYLPALGTCRLQCGVRLSCLQLLEGYRGQLVGDALHRAVCSRDAS